MPFNYFKVLSKDDKELIHSSFIKFLIEDEETNNYFLQALFPEFQKELSVNSIQLEKGYNRKRIDIEAWSEDGEDVLIVENKFKSFPYRGAIGRIRGDLCASSPQASDYTKYLLCFDPELVLSSIRGEWHFVGYREVYQVVERFLETEHGLNLEKEYFIRHYAEFLSGITLSNIPIG